jgi:fructosamine-3-kinase
MRSTESLAVLLENAMHIRIVRGSERQVHGGSINSAARIESDRGPIFVKHGSPEIFSRFETEAVGLKLLARAQAVRVPDVLGCARNDQWSFIALEWIDFAKSSRSSEATLGEQLAWQHRVVEAKFGLDTDNTIGATPQFNSWCDDWVRFFREHRLRTQLQLASQNGVQPEVFDRGAQLCEIMDAFFTSYRPVPSLLHGDLWGGNWATDTEDMPIMFDPAVYFGDRETDIAMTRLFGGFGPAFYTAYQSTWPLDQAAGTRSTLYNLYHVLNHFNLFGGAYQSQALSMIDRLLAELGH